MARKEFCEKDGIYISYTNNDVCFEDLTTAESILLNNNGEIIHSNFDDTKNEYFKLLYYQKPLKSYQILSCTFLLSIHLKLSLTFSLLCYLYLILRIISFFNIYIHFKIM